MFRRRAKTRTFKHNLLIASTLSFVAGVVNIVGIMSLQQLTTNVTGHFGFLVEEALQFNYKSFLVYFLFIFFFFLGSFISNILVETADRINERYIYIFPAFIESCILLSIAIFGEFLITNHPNVIAYTLLFAMGLQNALVTIISNAIVRTTHLTGLFTDLGIEMSQLFFYKRKHHRKKLISTITLRMRIITFFFIGGIIGGILFHYFSFHVFYLPAALLLFGVFYDYVKFKVLRLGRRIVEKF